jgi:hypothetical protein
MLRTRTCPGDLRLSDWLQAQENPWVDLRFLMYKEGRTVGLRAMGATLGNHVTRMVEWSTVRPDDQVDQPA